MSSNPLTSSKTPGILLAEIRMMSSSFRGVHFMVEGDDDSQFWKRHVHRTNVSIVNCEGKTNLVGAAALVVQHAIPSVMGIYDPDFDRHFGVVHSPTILATTDKNDLDVTLLVSAALDVVLHEFGDAERVERFVREEGVTVAEHIRRISSRFGELRYLNQVMPRGINFDRLSPYRFVSVDSWLLDSAALHSEYAALAGITGAALSGALVSTCPNAELWSLSQGHDAIRVLAQGLKRRIGKRQISEQDVGRLLRIAYSEQMLRSSAMYASLKLLERDVPTSMF